MTSRIPIKAAVGARVRGAAVATNAWEETWKPAGYGTDRRRNSVPTIVVGTDTNSQITADSTKTRFGRRCTMIDVARPASGQAISLRLGRPLYTPLRKKPTASSQARGSRCMQLVSLAQVATPDDSLVRRRRNHET